MTDEKKLDILSPDAKKWLEDQKKGRAELASESALYEERMANTRSNYEKFDREMKVDLWQMVGKTTSKQEFLKLRQAIIDKYDFDKIDKHGGRIDQAPYRMFSWRDIDLEKGWGEELTGGDGKVDIHDVKEYLAHVLNAKYFPGDQGTHPYGKPYERRRNVGLRTEGAPWPMKGEALERDRPLIFELPPFIRDGKKYPRKQAVRRRDFTPNDSQFYLDGMKLDRALMKKVTEMFTKDAGRIEGRARRNVEDERYEGLVSYIPPGQNSNRIHDSKEMGIRRKYRMPGLGLPPVMEGKAVAESAFSKSELEASRELEGLEGRTMDSPPLRFEPDTAESQEQRFERQRREENNQDKLRRLRELEEENRRRRREAIN
tara:strand:+ start:709 stop:1827 length:1119 start_codon:yes stop_codon:yes gene_type:complete